MFLTRAFARGINEAFTLLEILAGVAIIAVLAALLAPAVTRSIEKGKQAACVGKMKEIGAVCFAYASDNENELPGGANTGLTNWGDIWVFRLGPYFPNINGSANALWAPSLKCPSNKQFESSGSSYGPVMGNASFYGRCAGGVDSGNLFRPTRASAIPSPAKTPYWMEIDNTKFVDGLHPGGQALWQLPGIHSGGANVLMADGHVQFVRAKEWSESGGEPHPWAYHFALDYPKPNW